MSARVRTVNALVSEVTRSTVDSFDVLLDGSASESVVREVVRVRRALIAAESAFVLALADAQNLAAREGVS